MADTKILDNGTLVTLGLVGVVAAVGAANKAGLYGSRNPSRSICPGCGQEITIDQGFTECGGEGNGICAEAVFAYDQMLHGRPYAVKEWKDMWENDMPTPSQKRCEDILAAHDEAMKRGSMAKSDRYIVATIHDGTDYGVFKASRKDIKLGDDMSHAEAVATAKAAVRDGSVKRWYDFGDVEYKAD